MYKQAAFCLEEVLTMGLLNPLTLVKLADTLVTIGGAAQLKTARAYYSKALQVSLDKMVLCDQSAAYLIGGGLLS